MPLHFHNDIVGYRFSRYTEAGESVRHLGDTTQNDTCLTPGRQTGPSETPGVKVISHSQVLCLPEKTEENRRKYGMRGSAKHCEGTEGKDGSGLRRTHTRVRRCQAGRGRNVRCGNSGGVQVWRSEFGKEIANDVWL